MVTPTNPYKIKPERAFWRASVGSRHYADLADLWKPMPLRKSDRIATAGSCFAQHIGNNLAARGAAFMDMEPAPPVFASSAEARTWGYGVFSCRYGNIYTTRQLIQLFDEAHGNRTPVERVWQKQDRYFDALRVGVDPVGQDSPETVLALRLIHLEAVRRMFAELDVFVFTMGLTEGWENTEDGSMFAVAPGTVAGTYDPERHVFRNLRAAEIRTDMLAFWERLRAVNPGARMPRRFLRCRLRLRRRIITFWWPRPTPSQCFAQSPGNWPRMSQTSTTSHLTRSSHRIPGAACSLNLI